jgi:hypothetical protein
MAFEDQGDPGFSPAGTGLQQAAQQELDRRQSMLAGQTDARRGKASSAGGIVGAILGGFMGGPMGALSGYNVGSGLVGTAMGAKGARQPSVTDIGQMLGTPAPQGQAADSLLANMPVVRSAPQGYAAPGMAAMQSTLGMPQPLSLYEGSSPKTYGL